MKYRMLFILIVLLVSILSLNQLLTASGDKDKTPTPCCNQKCDQKCDKEVTLTGMFVCPHYLMMKDGQAMPDMAKVKECIVKCTEAGQPLLFVDDKGTVYMSLFCPDCKVTKKDAASMGMEKVSAKGNVLEKGGLKAFMICSVEKAGTAPTVKATAVPTVKATVVPTVKATAVPTVKTK
jgi:hypothetical protein